MARLKGFQIGFWKVLLSAGSIVFGIGAALRVAAQFRIARLMFETRPDDIFIATFPKSGTTLMQMIVYQLRTDGRMDFPHISSVCPWIENEFQRNRIRHMNKLASPRCFKTHLTADRLPIESGKHIYVLRDVRDVVVSAYHHSWLLGGVEQSLDQMAEKFLRAGSSSPVLPSWFAHVESWWPYRNRPNVLFVSYEKMVADLEGTIRQVAAFLGIELREEDMPRILESCSFAFMKRYEDKFDPRLQGAGADSPGFIRQGKAGSGRELSSQHQKIFETRLSALARRLGCERGEEPYGEIVTAMDRPGLGAAAGPG